MRKPFQIQQTQYQVTMSIGCCPIYLPSTQSLDVWITKADLALREAKLRGGNTLVMHAAQSVMSHPSHSIAGSAHAALQKDAQGRVLGAEMMLPHDLSHLDHWFAYLEILHKRFQTNLGDQQNNFCLSIDLPLSLSLNHPRFSQDLLQGLHQLTSTHRLNPKAICLEIDEHWLFQSTALLRDVLTQIRAANYLLCLDHYGRAQSRLHSQSEYSFDRVKIAASLCEQLTHEPKAVTQIRAILAVAQALGQTPIALLPAMQEAPLDLLQALACPNYQEPFTEG
jgi:EAL domain-containing protein (putative c-di-GMP-specific phosphodiesterase class I)